MSLIESFILISGLIYIFLATRNKSACWIFGIICSGLLVYTSTVKYKLYADALLNVFYVVMGVIGLYSWYTQDSREEDQRLIRSMTMSLWVKYLGMGLLCTIAMGSLLAEYSDAFATYWDAGTTVFSILATILLVQRYAENWIFWIIIDIIMMVLYYQRGGEQTALLFGVYTVFAAYGWYNWRRLYRGSFGR